MTRKPVMAALATVAVALVGLSGAWTASADPDPYDPSGCIANPQAACGSDGNPIENWWRDSPNGPIVSPACAEYNTCVPGEIIP